MLRVRAGNPRKVPQADLLWLRLRPGVLGSRCPGGGALPPVVPGVAPRVASLICTHTPPSIGCQMTHFGDVCFLTSFLIPQS